MMKKIKSMIIAVSIFLIATSLSSVLATTESNNNEIHDKITTFRLSNLNPDFDTITDQSEDNNAFLPYRNTIDNIIQPWEPNSTNNTLKFAPGHIIIKFKSKVDDILTTEKALTEALKITESDPSFATPLSAKPIFSENTKNSDEKKTIGLDRWVLIKVANDTNISEEVKKYNNHPSVEVAQPDYQVKVCLVPDDPYYSSYGSWGQDYPDMYGLHLLDTEHAWDITTGDDEVVVAVVDTGVDYTHPDLAENIWINPGEDINHNGIVDPEDFNGIDDDENGFIDDIRGWDFVGTNYIDPQPDNDPMDGYGHGTHCAGTIGAVGNNGVGVVGVNWQTKIMPVKGADDRGYGWISNLSDGIRYAADNGAHIISNSWGHVELTPSDPIVEDAVHYAHDQGCIIVFAAGNSNSDVKYDSPANMNETIAVAATDHNDEKPLFSCYGEKIDVSAPGVDILSTVPENLGSRESNITIIYPQTEHIDSTGFVYSAVTPPEGITADLINCGLGRPADFVGLDVVGKIALIERGDLYFYEKVQNAADADATGVLIYNDEPGIFLGTLGSLSDIPAASISQENGLYLIDLLDSDRVTINLIVEDSPYGRSSGTSMACPHVAGLAALIKAQYPGLTNEEIRSRLAGTTDDINILLLDGATWTLESNMISLGSGRINASRALTAEPSPSIRCISYTLQDVKGTENRYNLTVSLKNYWVDAQNVSLTVEIDDNPAVTLHNNQVFYGYINNGEVVSNPDDPFVLTVDYDLITDFVPFNVTMTIEADDGYIESFPHMLSLITVPEGWPIVPDEWPLGWGDDSYGMIYGSRIAICDLDNDGEKEIVFPSIRSLDDPHESHWLIDVYTMDGEKKTGWTTFTVPTDNLFMGQKGREYVQVGDVNGDKQYEVIFSHHSEIYVLDNNGSVMPGWPVTLSSGTENIIARDVTHDGCDEVIFISGGWVFVLNSTGQCLQGWPQQFSDVSGLAVGDVDHDGNVEIVVAGGDQVRVYNADGVVENSGSVSGGSWPYLGDVDADGYDEIIIRAENYIYVLNHTCQIMEGWPVHVDSGSVGHIVLGNITGDSKPEIIAKITDVGLYVFNEEGDVLPGFPVYDDFDKSVLTIGDIDNDGRQEIIASRAEPGEIHILPYDGDGTFLQDYKIVYGEYWWIKFSGEQIPYTGVINIDDMDNDGKLELIYSGEYVRLYRIELPVRNTGSDWPTLGHDHRRTNRYVGKQVWVDDDFNSSTPGFGVTCFNRIQDAVEGVNVNQVFVYSGTYNENLVINKDNIRLVGEDRDATVIDGGGDTVVRVLDSGFVGIAGFTITNGTQGVSLESSSHVIVIGNNLIYNNEGVTIGSGCSGNFIFHNSFNNSVLDGFDAGSGNMWDNGYPSGGNYWNNYTGVDEYRGPYQDIAGGDGIGDTPYTVFDSGESKDWYPLMSPWSGSLPVQSLDVVYVDDDFDSSTVGWGYDHFDNIQSGIAAVAWNGQVSVNSGMYHESFFISRSVNLIGEDKDSTIIDGGVSIADLADNVVVTGFTVQDSIGIEILSDYNTVYGNIINNGEGVSLSGSSYNTISENEIRDGSGNGITLEDSSGNLIQSNNITDNDNMGTYQVVSSDNTITDNVINGNTYDVIWLQESSDNTIMNNSLGSNGIVIEGDELRFWTHTIVNNTAYGRPICYYKNTEDIVVPDDASQVILADCTGFTIENLNIDDVTRGIQLGWSSENTISNNTIVDNQRSISIIRGNTNIVSDNTITNNHEYGIYLRNSGENLLSQNSITDNNGKGVYLHDIDAPYPAETTRCVSNIISGNTINGNQCGSGVYLGMIYMPWWCNNTISDNTITNCEYGIRLERYYGYAIIINNTITDNQKGVSLSSTHNVISGNTLVDNNEYGIAVGVGSQGNIISGNSIYGSQRGIWVGWQVHRTTISNNTIGSNHDGIYLGGSGFVTVWMDTHNKIFNNTIIDNHDGIHLEDCSYTNITSNIIADNYNYGIYIDKPSNHNNIYHNDFYNNLEYNAYDEGVTIWDDGYPSGGNHWDDYLEIYPDANEVDDSGIWDTPYDIPGGSNQDNFPLMNGVLFAFADGSYYGVVSESIQFNGSAYGGCTPYNWSWDFGDGNISHEQNTTHIYAIPGIYTVNLTVTDNHSNTDTSITTATITYLADAHGPYTGVIGESIHFNGSVYGGYPPYNWSWDFDDGNFSYGQNATHIYTTTGIFTVTLTVTDDKSNTDTSITTATITYLADAHGPYTGVIGESIHFNGSVYGGYPPYNWTWDFGDGNISHEQNTTHTYATAGIFTVNLTVTDDKSNTDTSITTATITYLADAHGPYIGMVNESILFNGSAYGGYSPYNWSWDFGDGNISYEQNPTHNYTKIGTYVVNLTVTDEEGNSDTTTTLVYITYELGLVACWHFDEGSGCIAHDSSGIENHGDIDGASWTAGVSGSALHFDGVDDFIVIDDSDSLSFTNNELTIEAWVKVDSLPTWETSILRKEDQWAIQFADSDTVRNLVRTDGINGWTMFNDEDYAFETNAWYYWTFVYNGSHAIHTINAEQVGPPHIVTGNIIDYDSPVYIACNPRVGRYLSGTIDEVRIYNRALTDEEIQAQYEEFSPLCADANGPYEVFVNETIQFTGSAVGGSPPYNCLWDFGDGTNSTLQNPTHNYTMIGTYVVNLTVTDEEGNSDSDTITTTAIFLADAHGTYAGFVNEPIQFIGSAYGGYEPYTWYWDFGDGNTSTLQNPTHNYTMIGTYLVNLTIMDNQSNSDTDTTMVTIIFLADAHGPYYGLVNETVQFNGSSYGGYTPFNWSWDFGDGNTSNIQNSTHNYTRSGIYTVNLTVTDNSGNSDTDTTTATINEIEELMADAGGPYSGVVGEPLDFTGFATGGVSPYSWSWDFDGNGIEDSDEQNSSYTFNELGEYTVTLTVSDNQSIPVEDSDETIVIIVYERYSIYYYNSVADYGIGFTGSNQVTWEAAIRITPEELAGYEDIHLYAARFYHQDNGIHSGYLKIYDEGTSTSPGPLLISVPYTSDDIGWKSINLPEFLELDINKDLWISIEITHDDGEYPIACDSGPVVPQKGDFVNINDDWSELRTYGLGCNWNIEALLGSIEEQPLVANASGPYTGLVGESIQFIGSASGGLPPYNWTWDFGDGNVSYDQNATHVYETAGEYTAILTVTDSRDISDNDTALVTVGTGFIWVDDDFDESTPGWQIDHFNNIQDGIDVVGLGETVYVYNGIYEEQITVDGPMMTLMGENRETVVIDGNGNGDVVKITAPSVTVKGFTIQNSGTSLLNADAGIKIVGGVISANHDIFISNNIIMNNKNGIYLELSLDNNVIKGNLIKQNNDIGIRLGVLSENNAIYHNTLIDNAQNARDWGINIWDNDYPSGGNYWSDYEERYPDAQEIDDSGIWDIPYNIPPGSNQDRYPLMQPWVENQAPYTPDDPDPTDSSTDVPVDAVLSWTGGDPDPDDIVTYDVYFGTTSPPPKVEINQTTTVYSPGTLGYETTYYWQIITWDNHNTYAEGHVWSFTTLDEPNSPPYIPGNPDPENGATDVDIDYDVSWNGGDPDQDDTVSYDIYLGASSDPPYVLTIGPYPATQTLITYDPGTLDYETTYYWKIIVWDNHNVSAEGPVWSFTTEEEPDVTPPTIVHRGDSYISISNDSEITPVTSNDFEITAVIRDDVSLPQNILAYVDYRPANCFEVQPPDENWLTIEMEYDEEDRTHRGIIPAREIERIYEQYGPDCATLEYRIGAKDEAENEAVTKIYCVEII